MGDQDVKIGLVRREFGGYGGAELYAHRLMEEICRRGHKLTFVTAGEIESVPFGVEVAKVALPRSRAEKVIWFEKLARRELSTKGVDCVFSLEKMGAQDVYRAGDGVHATWLDQRRKYARWWRRPFIGRGKFHKTVLWLERQTLNPHNTRHIIANSDFIKNNIITKYNYPGSRIHVVRNGVEVGNWKNGDRHVTRKQWGVGPSDFVLLFAGSGWERKGLHYALRAFGRLGGNCKFIIAGKGSPPLICPANVIFTGTVGDLENAYTAADLLVFPPIYEPSANVVYEALASGLPVVTTRQNGASEIIDDGVNGTIIEDAADIKGMVNAIKRWREKKPGFRISTEFDLSIERNVDETMQVLEIACSEIRSKHR